MNPNADTRNGWQAFQEAYFNRQALSLLLLGFCAGLPYLLIFSNLGIWLREAGIDRGTVTMFSWAMLGYSFKFIWSPLIDTLPLPLLNRLGKRRSWLLLSQVLIIIAITMIAMIEPSKSTLSLMAMSAVLLGFSAATQDVVIDAYRIECAPSQMQTALSASYVGGYRIGLIVAGAGVLYLAEYFGSTKDHYSYLAWQKTYLIMALIMLIGVATATFFLKEPDVPAKTLKYKTNDYLALFGVFLLSVVAFIGAYRFLGSVLPSGKELGVGLLFLLGCVQFIGSSVAMFVVGFILVKLGMVRQEVAVESWIAPITNFFERYGKQALWLLALIGLYRISDIVAGNISNLFYQEMGFTKEQIADAVKVVGVVASIGGGFIGGWFAQKTSIMKAMFVGALLACLTNLLFIGLFYTPTMPMMYVAVIVDNLAAGLASAVFIAFLSALTSIRFTAVQYALFSSLMTLSPKILGGYSGAIVEATSYPIFFAITCIIGLPVLALVYLVGKKIPLQAPDAEKVTHANH